MLGGVAPRPQRAGRQRSSATRRRATAVAVEQYRTKYVFLAPTDYTVSYVDIVDADGRQRAARRRADHRPAHRRSAPATASRARPSAPGNDGAHVLTSTAAVGIQVIGYGKYTSYQYPGGLNLGAIAPPPPPPT